MQNIDAKKLNKDAGHIDERIEDCIKNIASDYVVDDSKIIVGLEAIKKINEDTNYEVIGMEEYNFFTETIKAYYRMKASDYGYIHPAKKLGIDMGLRIVSTYAMLNEAKKSSSRTEEKVF